MKSGKIEEASGASGEIFLRNVREHNLKGFDLSLPRGKWTVITGVSGSGKSSLAFDTLFAEGYRKYIDSLSVKARQVLDQIRKPAVDYIEGLSPVIAIEQKTGAGGNPRATLATVTEVADFARLLWVFAGESVCPVDGSPIRFLSLEENMERVLELPEGTRVMLLAPVFQGKVSVAVDEVARLRQRGYTRIRMDGEIRELEDRSLLRGLHGEVKIDLVVDRIVLQADIRSRLADSLETAFSEGDGAALILHQMKGDSAWKEFSLSQRLASTLSGIPYEPLSVRTFSPSHPEGACPECGGLGNTLQFVEELVVPDPRLSVKKGAIKAWRMGSKAMIIRRNALLKQLAEQLPFDALTEWDNLSEPTKEVILHGSGSQCFSFKLKGGNTKPELMPFEGVIPELERTVRETRSEGYRNRMLAFQTSHTCRSCGGKRLGARARNVFVKGRNFTDFLGMSVHESKEFLEQLAKDWGEEERRLFGEVHSGLLSRLRFLEAVGLEYLTLDREYRTLSGGECQRARLATQLGMGLVGVLYLLDEPSIGLHPSDNERLIRLLSELRDRGNTLIVVEHDEETIRSADWLVEIGPGAGVHGGEILFQGTPEEAAGSDQCLTGRYLSGRDFLVRESPPKQPDGRWLEILGAMENNLQHLDVRFPVGLFTCVTGVSGSGKSTLVNDILAKAAAFRLNRTKEIPGRHRRIDGLEYFQRAITVDQTPIGRSPRSNPATFVKAFDLLRQVFAQCPLSRIRGYSAGRFSFNTAGGRCEKCQGNGQIAIDLQFLGESWIPCPSCEGKRYNRETLEVRYKGHSIADVLEMTVQEALDVFSAYPRLQKVFETMVDVGLDYLRLGQPATTLSGGEAQRLKLSLELSRMDTGANLYILDEPTTGLHWKDIQMLLNLMLRLRDRGNTLIVIEHQLDLIGMADWLIDLGPGGGKNGGQLLYSGIPADIADKESPTGRAIATKVTPGN